MYKVIYFNKSVYNILYQVLHKELLVKRMKWTSGRNNDIDTAAYLPAQWYDHICYERSVQGIMKNSWQEIDVEWK